MKQRIITLLLFVVLLISTASGQRGWNWSEVAPMSVPRMEHMSAVVDGTIYVFGGRTHDRRNRMMPISSAEKYSPIDDEWTDIEPLPYPLFLAGVKAVDNKIYLFGGVIRGFGQPIDSMLVYDTDRDYYQVIGSMPVRMHSFELQYVPNRGSLFCAGGIGRGLDDFFRTSFWYNVRDDDWEEGLDLPIATAKLGMALRGNFLWITGGFSIGGAQNTNYVLSGREWSERAELPVHIGDHSSAFMEDTLIVAGGINNRRQIVSDVSGFLPGINRWFSLPNMTSQRASFELLSVGDTLLYAIGGQTQLEREHQMILESVEVCAPVDAIGDVNGSPINGAVSVVSNHSRGLIEFQLTSGVNRIRIVDLNGRKIADKLTSGASDWTWNSDGYPNGSYFYSVTHENQKPLTGRIIVIK